MNADEPNAGYRPQPKSQTRRLPFGRQDKRKVAKEMQRRKEGLDGQREQALR
jgi:hypothetical protein